MSTPNHDEPARFTPQDLTCPPTTSTDATTKLLDFAIITWAISPSALAKHLPEGMEPDLYTLDDGQEVAFISAVPFRDADFHFHFAPFYKVAMGQTNYRAYVRYKGQRCVWFFGTTLTGFWRWIPSALWRLPWNDAKINFKVSWDQDTLQRYELNATSSWAPMQLDLEGTGQPMPRLDGFKDQEDAAVVLTHPLMGYYYRRDGQLGSYHVWHDKLTLEVATVRSARAELFERLELITSETPVHSALVQRETTFTIFLPPTLVR